MVSGGSWDSSSTVKVFAGPADGSMATVGRGAWRLNGWRHVVEYSVGVARCFEEVERGRSARFRSGFPDLAGALSQLSWSSLLVPP